MYYQINLSVDRVSQEVLLEKLLERFPEFGNKGFNGNITSFKVRDREDAPRVVEVMDYIRSSGYEFDRFPKDVSNKVHLERSLVWEESDFNRAKFVMASSTKQGRSGQIGYVRKNRAKINSPPPKFRYCFQQWVCLVTKSVKSKLEANNFVGLNFLPVDLVKDARANSPSDYDGHLPEEPLSEVWSLYGTAILPDPGANCSGQFSSDQLAVVREMDIVLSSKCIRDIYDVRWIYFSQRLRQFWTKNFGDMEWSDPIFVEE